MTGSLCYSMNMELILGTAAPVSNIVQVQKVFCPGTEMCIMTIAHAPDHGAVFWTNCIFTSYAFLLGFDLFTCFCIVSALVCFTPATEYPIFCDMT
jgi:hypothetical protein